MSQAERTTEIIERHSKEDGVLIKMGKSRWTVPTATILTACLCAVGTVWKIADAERTRVWEAIDRLDKSQQSTDSKLAVEAVTLTNIQVQLARIDARVAEVQVTLMRGNR